MSTAPRFLGVGAVLGLAAGLLVGVGLMQPGQAAATTPTAAPTVPSAGPALGAPGVPPAITPSGTGVAVSGSAIAYPYFGGTPGVAPDHTIVVTGQGQADLKSDGSDRAATEKSALAAALADARAQADTIAAETGLSISGVLSVSASVYPSYGVIPMTGAANGPTSGQPAAPNVVPQPPFPQTLGVSVTVAYQVS